ncbi:MAG: glycosyltransferase family 39 protein [Gemmatimonadaceae bacterium]
MNDVKSTALRGPTLGGRPDVYIPLAIAAMVFAIAISTVTPWPVGAFEDDAVYTILGKSLAEGTGYRMINLPGAPAATHYPPGYPALLSVLWRISPSFPDNVVLFKFANALLLAIAAAGTYCFARRRLDLSRLASSVTALITTLSIAVLLLTGMVLSEPLFLALLIPALFVTERAVETGRVRTALFAGVLLGMLTLVRSLGLFAIPGAFALLLWRRRYAAAAALALGAAVLAGPWLVWVELHQNDVPHIISGKYGSYSGWVLQGYKDYGIDFIWQVIVKNSQDLYRVLSRVHTPIPGDVPRALTFIALIALLALGATRLTRRAPATLLFILLYCFIVMLWPFEPSRFVLGIWPVLACCAALGVRTLLQWRPARPMAISARYAALAACLGLAIGWGRYNGQGFKNGWWEPIQRAEGERLKPIVQWVAYNTAMTDVISTDHDPAVYLYTGRRAIPTNTWLVRERITPLSADEELNFVRQLVSELQPDYYVPTSIGGERTAKILAKESTPLLRYLGQTRNGAAFALVRQ